MDATEAYEYLKKLLSQGGVFPVEACVNASSPDQTARALLAWSNLSPPIQRYNLVILADMSKKGNFEFWACPECNGAVLFSSDARVEAWQRPNQRDVVLIPLRCDEDRRCDHCRLYNVDGGMYPNGRKVLRVENPF